MDERTAINTFNNDGFFGFHGNVFGHLSFIKKEYINPLNIYDELMQ